MSSCPKCNATGNGDACAYPESCHYGKPSNLYNQWMTPEEIADLKSKYRGSRELASVNNDVHLLIAEVERLDYQRGELMQLNEELQSAFQPLENRLTEAKQEIEDWKRRYTDKVALADKWWVDLEKCEQHIAELLDINQRLEQQLAVSQKALEMAAEALMVWNRSHQWCENPPDGCKHDPRLYPMPEYWLQQAREVLGK